MLRVGILVCHVWVRALLNTWQPEEAEEHSKKLSCRSDRRKCPMLAEDPELGLCMSCAPVMLANFARQAPPKLGLWVLELSACPLWPQADFL